MSKDSTEPPAKTLFCCAHHGEASALFARKSWQKSGVGLGEVFNHSDGYLLAITGEGLFSALRKVSYLLGAYQGEISRVINFGCVGSLSETLAVGEVAAIRTVYASPVVGHYEYKSFTSADRLATKDCLSSGQRVLESANTPSLIAYAKMVDRELWAVASAADAADVEWEAIKVVSDMIGSTDCQRVRDHVEPLSEAMYAPLLEIANRPVSTKSSHSQTQWVEEFDECHFTHSSLDQLNKWARVLARQYSLPQEQIAEFIRRHPDFAMSMEHSRTPKAKGLGVVRLAERIATHV